MARAEPSGRPVRRGGREPRFTVDEILAAALDLVDEEGLQGFSMRRLAERLGVGPMTLYGYVRTSEEILDGVIELALRDLIADAAAPGDWEEQLKAVVRDLHDALAAHPGVLELLLAKPAPSEHLDSVREALLSVLRRAGFSDDDVWGAVGFLGSYAVGFATSQVSFRRAGPAAERLGALPADTHPNLVELAPRYPSHLADAAFERGLDHLVDGLRRELGPRR